MWVVSVWGSTSYELITKLSGSPSILSLFLQVVNMLRVVMWTALYGCGMRSQEKKLYRRWGNVVDPVYVLAFLRDGTRLMSGGQDKNIIVGIQTGRMDHKLLTRHMKTILCLASVPTRTCFALGSCDQLIRCMHAQRNVHHPPPLLHWWQPQHICTLGDEWN